MPLRSFFPASLCAALVVLCTLLCAPVQAQTPDEKSIKLAVEEAVKAREPIGFVYVEATLEGYQVRQEFMLPFQMLEEWASVDRESTATLTYKEQRASEEKLAEVFRSENPIVVDGKPHSPSVTKVQYFDTRDMWQLVVLPIPVERAVTGLISSYPVEERPMAVKATWTLFPEGVDSARQFLMVEGYPPAMQRATREKPELAWDIPANPPEPRPVDPVPATKEQLAKFPASITEDAEATYQIVVGLLTNIYLAFDSREETVIYDALEKSLEGELLSQVYLQMRQGVADRQGTGAMARVEGVSILSGDVLRTGTGDDNTPFFVYSAAWDVAGSVSHWGHGHPRGNRYEAQLTITPKDGAWKITGFRLISQQPTGNPIY